MYHATLTNRYLTSRVIPFIAVAAVALCVALVIIVVSVMTGFLDMVRSAGRTLMGDVVVSYPVRGIPYYDRFIERVESLDEAEAASAAVDSWGLLRMPYPDGPGKETETVQVWGVDESFARVTEYDETIHWRELRSPFKDWLVYDLVLREGERLIEPLDYEARKAIVKAYWDRNDPDLFAAVSDDEHRRRIESFVSNDWRNYLRELIFPPGISSNVRIPEADRLRTLFTEDNWNAFVASDPRLVDPTAILEAGRSMRDPLTGEPGAVVGLHVSRANERNQEGDVVPMDGAYWFMPRFDVTLTTIPIDSTGGLIEPESFILPVVNEFRSGVYLIDDKRVLIPLDRAQRMLGLAAGEFLDDEGEEVVGIDPARATLILVRAADGVSPDSLRTAVADAYMEFQREIGLDPNAMVSYLPDEGRGVSILTWEQQQAQFIGPIEKERELMRTLFSLVYLVCAGLVLSIFWAIVYEKTRDIGILRSIGASRAGISWIFLRYGLVVGVLGALLGVLLGWLVVRNINSIHDAMGNPPLWLGLLFCSLAAISLVFTAIKSRGGFLLPIVLGTLATLGLALIGTVVLVVRDRGGLVIWDPSVYYFTEIPNSIDVGSTIFTVIGAVAFSVLGAFIPAAKAADTHPVKALRYE